MACTTLVAGSCHATPPTSPVLQAINEEAALSEEAADAEDIDEEAPPGFTLGPGLLLASRAATAAGASSTPVKVRALQGELPGKCTHGVACLQPPFTAPLPTPPARRHPPAYAVLPTHCYTLQVLGWGPGPDVATDVDVDSTPRQPQASQGAWGVSTAASSQAGDGWWPDWEVRPAAQLLLLRRLQMPSCATKARSQQPAGTKVTPPPAIAGGGADSL
jgi:hypothetical protein